MEFDQTMPVSSEKKNYLKENKKRLKCRSSSKKKSTIDQDSKTFRLSSSKKSSMKKDML